MRTYLTKKERIINVLRENSPRWLSAGEIARLFHGSRWISARDVAMNLRGVDCIERMKVSLSCNPYLKYRYKETDE